MNFSEFAEICYETLYNEKIEEKPSLQRVAPEDFNKVLKEEKERWKKDLKDKIVLRIECILYGALDKDFVEEYSKHRTGKYKHKFYNRLEEYNIFDTVTDVDKAFYEYILQVIGIIKEKDSEKKVNYWHYAKKGEWWMLPLEKREQLMKLFLMYVSQENRLELLDDEIHNIEKKVITPIAYRLETYSIYINENKYMRDNEKREEYIKKYNKVFKNIEKIISEFEDNDSEEKSEEEYEIEFLEWIGKEVGKW